jgi:opacity protein-like surface antigen
MKKGRLLLVIVIGLCNTAAFGLAPLGPPKAGLDQGQYHIGLDYSHGETDLEFSGGGESETLEVESDMIFANLGYGLAESWEGFVRLGISSVEVEGFDSGNEFAYGFGTKVTITEHDAVTWGGLFQIGWFEGDDTVDGVDVDIDAYEIQIAFGPTYKYNEKCLIYGGPFLHLVDGDGKLEAVLPGWGAVSGNFDVEQESEFGGYVGAQVDLTDNSSFFVEYQLTGDAWAVGTGINWKF